MSCGGFVTRAAPGLPYTPGNFDERLAFTVQSIIMLSTVLAASGYEGPMLWSRSYDGASLLAYLSSTLLIVIVMNVLATIKGKDFRLGLGWSVVVTVFFLFGCRAFLF